MPEKMTDLKRRALRIVPRFAEERQITKGGRQLES
jgi:hypothetical protein